MAKRTGPLRTITMSCDGCAHERSSHYAVQGDSGYIVRCAHPTQLRGELARYIGDSTWRTPEWCPERSGGEGSDAG